MPAFDIDAFDSEAFDTGISAAASSYARMLIDLLPRGRALKLLGTLLRDLLEGCAAELVRVDARIVKMLSEAIPTEADELIPEYESELELPSTGTDEERVARIVAQELADQGFRPEDVQAILAPLLAQAPVDVVVLERTAAFAASIGDQREIYRFFVYRDPGAPGAYYVDAAQDLLDGISHSHVQGYVIESVDFLTDDPYSLTDRDLLGA